MADLMEVETPSEGSVTTIAGNASSFHNTALTAGEVGWLLSTRRTPMVMYHSKNECLVDYYHIPVDRMLKYDHAHLSVDTTISCVTSPEGVVTIENEDVHDIKRKKLAGYLEGRFGPEISAVSDRIIAMRDDGEEIFADTVLLDVRSIFMVLRRRHQKDSAALRTSNGVTRCCELAAEGTMRYVSDVMRYFRDNFVMAEIFLSSNAVNLEIEVDVDYRGGKATKEMYIASLARCREYLAAIREVAAMMR